MSLKWNKPKTFLRPIVTMYYFLLLVLIYHQFIKCNFPIQYSAEPQQMGWSSHCFIHDYTARLT